MFGVAQIVTGHGDTGLRLTHGLVDVVRVDPHQHITFGDAPPFADVQALDEADDPR